VITVSTDTAAEIRLGRGLHGLQATMLADPKLKLTNLFGLKNKNLNNFRLPGRPGLPVPTSLLVNESGIVVWKEQASDYARRSEPGIIKAALTECFS
jgi:peroxiredoxin